MILLTCSLPSNVFGIVTHGVMVEPLVVMAVIRASSSSRFSFSFFTRLVMALLKNWKQYLREGAFAAGYQRDMYKTLQYIQRTTYTYYLADVPCLKALKNCLVKCLIKNIQA